MQLKDWRCGIFPSQTVILDIIILFRHYLDIINYKNDPIARRLGNVPWQRDLPGNLKSSIA